MTCAASLTACATSWDAHEVRSLFGERLVPPDVSEERRAELAALTAEARARHAEDPTDEDAIIWLGRRLSYEADYRDAIAVYSRGLEIHPDSYRLRRHRGHRFISCRDFERAVEDLSAASELAWDVPDSVEPDGAPNPTGIPRSTRQGNIAYHLGLAHYLRGDFEAARRAYERGLTFSRNDDGIVSMSWWYHLTLRRLGRDTEADALLEGIHEDMEILENHGYHRLLLMAAGQVEPEELLPDGVASIEDATVAYGIAAFHLVEGRQRPARALFAQIVAGPHWMAFGHIAAEAELWRAGAGR